MGDEATTVGGKQPRSILLVDIGTILSKVVLIDRSKGRCRVVARGQAPTTLDPPWADVTLGLRDAISQVSVETGREFFGRSGELISPEVSASRGVDAVAVTVSAAPSLGLVVCGLSDEVSLSSARAAAAGTYGRVLAALSPEATGGVWQAGEWARRIAEEELDAILVAGGTEGGGALPTLLMVYSALSGGLGSGGTRRPVVVFAGNSRLREDVVQLVGDVAELRFVENLRPALAREKPGPATRALDALYIERKVGELPGFDGLRRWGLTALEPSAGAFGRLVGALAHLEAGSQTVLGVDVGAGHTVIASASSGDARVAVNEEGVARINRVMGAQGIGAVVRWLPENLPRGEVVQLLGLRMERPALAPQSDQALWVDQALAREAIVAARPRSTPPRSRRGRRIRAVCPNFYDTIVASGGVLTHAPRPGQAALILLDALEPAGVTRLLLDANGLAGPLGAVAETDAECVVEVLDAGGLVALGTVIAPAGRARPGDRVLRARVTFEDGAKLDLDVVWGDLKVVPLPPGQWADLRLRPRRGIDVGLGGPGRGGARRVSGGLAGLILDARGRPLVLASGPGERVREARRWLSDIGG